MAKTLLLGVTVGILALHVIPAARRRTIRARRCVSCMALRREGISDVLARSIGARLTSSMGQQVVVDPRPGAGTTIASEQIAKSPADGYTLFLQDITTHAIKRQPLRRLPYTRCAISRRSRSSPQRR